MIEIHEQTAIYNSAENDEEIGIRHSNKKIFIIFSFVVIGIVGFFGLFLTIVVCYQTFYSNPEELEDLLEANSIPPTADIEE